MENPKDAKTFTEVDPALDEIASKVVDAAFKVHSKLGPGLLENAYEACLAYEITQKGLRIEQQKPLPLVYESVKLNVGFRIDLLVEDRLIVEIKAVDSFAPIHEAQVLTYLRLMDQPLALLINFNTRFIKNGLRRIVLSKK